MTLQEYLDKNNLKRADMARMLNVSRSAVQNWCEGERIPGPGHMVEIYRATKGRVKPNDFYKLER